MVLLDVVLTTVNVLWESLGVVLVVVATVVDEALVDSVPLGSTLPSSNILSFPVGPQSINPATVVVRPSWDLSKLSHLSCLLALINTLPLDKTTESSAIPAKASAVSVWEYFNRHSLHAVCPLSFRCFWILTFGQIPALLSWGGGTGLRSRRANGLTVLQWSLLGISQRGCKRGRDRGTDLGMSLIPSPWLRGLHKEKSRVRWVMANRIHTQCPTQLAGLKAEELQTKTKRDELFKGWVRKKKTNTFLHSPTYQLLILAFVRTYCKVLLNNFLNSAKLGE